ncbi:MAG: serine/threonine-protein kinase [Bacteroidota bacterium]
MDTPHWDDVRTLFENALEHPPEERAAFLTATCEDPTIRREVEELLAAHDDEGPMDHLGASWTPASEALTVPSASSEGRRVGPYRVIRRLGRGGMGEVFLAERVDGQFERQVALKLLRDGLESSSMRERFLHERQTLARLEHPGIARLIDGGLAEDDRPYFAMEAVAGERIDRYCDTQRYTVPQRLELFGQVCRAVHHAHQRLVVHRDLKPSNILVTETDGTPTVKLLDFGIAWLIEDASSSVETRTRLLTPEYAAPEQISGGEISTTTDVYSLGVVLYELLTGQRPFALADLAPGEVVRTVCEIDPPAPSTAVSQIGPGQGDGAALTPTTIGHDRGTEPDTLVRRLRGDLDTICLKALEKDPERRYASAEAFLDDIQRHLNGVPVRARPASAGYRVRKFISRHRAGVVLSTLAVLMLVASLATMTVLANRAAAERDRAQAEAAKAEQVSGFLQTLLDPMTSFQSGISTGDSSLAVVEVVRRAAASLDETLADQPEVLATVHRTLGQSFFGLGLMEEAEHHVRASLVLRDSVFAGQPHPNRIQSLEDLSSLLVTRSDQVGLGEWTEADSLMRVAHDLTRERFGEGSLELAQSLLGLVYRTPFSLRGDRATDALEEAYGIWRSHSNLPLETGHALRVQMAIDHLEKLRFTEADSAFAAVAAEMPSYATPDDLRWADIHHNWSAVHVLTGDMTRAEAHLDTALAVIGRGLPEEHPNVIMTRGLRAPILLDRGAHAEAEALLRPTLEALRQETPGSLAILVAESLLGTALAGQGRDAEAESLLVESLRFHRITMGNRHHWTPFMARQLVAFYDARGRSDEADPYRPLLELTAARR